MNKNQVGGRAVIGEGRERPVQVRQTVPFMVSTVPAGFPSPADDYLDQPLDFNELLIAHPAATFAVRVAGDSMTGAVSSPVTSQSSIARLPPRRPPERDIEPEQV